MTDVPGNWVALGNRVAFVLRFKTEGDEEKDSKYDCKCELHF